MRSAAESGAFRLAITRFTLRPGRDRTTASLSQASLSQASLSQASIEARPVPE